ncbi:hypothetical protein BJN44_10730 [Tessaracoccus sp. ZS01]|nr:hypothetical protein BJN44_10730 [Tessaracoccus sp. ZS01]
MYAMLTFESGDADLALQEVADMNQPLAEAVKGYILLKSGEYRKAASHLRTALREQPDDPDSLLNLSICLWYLGSRDKATVAALRATRSSPGRKDVSLHYLNLLLEQEKVAEAEAEIRSLSARGVIEDPDLLVAKARTLMARGDLERAIPILRDAAALEDDTAAGGEIRGNLVVLRYEADRITHEEAVKQLVELMSQFPASESLVVLYARFARTADHATFLRSALDRVRGGLSPLRLAYLNHQVALLEGDNEAAADAALEWFVHERGNPMAAAAAIVSLGIGSEKWDEAMEVAREALGSFPEDLAITNNAAYVLAMAGHAQEAIALLEPIAGDDFVLNATLGLAHLADGNIGTGMRLYREAADRAERIDPLWRSLMTSYQALVVRQLGLLESQPEQVISALALAQVSPPADWAMRPDFLRLFGVAQRHGYPWPLAL